MSRNSRFLTALALCAFVVVHAAPSIAATHVAGRVASAQTNAPIAGASVLAYWTPLPLALGSTTTGPDGLYQLTVACPSATCTLQVSAAGFQQDAASFAASEIDIVRDFALQTSGSLSGTVALDVGAVAEGPIPVRIERWNASASTWTSVSNSEVPATGGAYSAGSLTPGTYRACAGGGASALRRQCFDGIDQGAFAAPTYTPVVVEPGLNHAGVNFLLRKGGAIAGRVRDAYRNTGLADSSLAVFLYDSNGEILNYVNNSVSTDVNGDYSLGGLAPGEYYLLLQATSAAFKDGYQFYPDASCGTSLCSIPAAATRIAVAAQATTTGIDYTYHPYSVLRGLVKARATGALLPTARVASWGFPGFIYATAFRDAQTGEYIFYVPDGGARVAADLSGYVSQFVPNINCYALPTQCALAAPNTVLAADEIRSGVDLLLDAAGTLPISVRALQGGAGLNANLTVYDIDGNPLWTGSNGGNINFSVPVMRTGPVFIKAETAIACEVHAHRPCPVAGAPLSSVQPTQVEVTTTTPTVIFEMVGDPIFTAGFESD